MGSRAIIIVIDGAGTELYYDHWAAQTLGEDAALDGFEATLARVRSMEPMAVSSLSEWVATWIDGSMLIDVPRRRVFWAEEGEGSWLPRVINHVIERSWPGWTAIWSPEKVGGILLTGTGLEPAFADLQVRPKRNPADDAWFAPEDERVPGGPLSVRLEDGEVILWRTDAALEDIAVYGPDGIIDFACRVRDARSSGRGGGHSWLPVDPDESMKRTVSGFHVDVAARSVRWWSTAEEDPCTHEFAAYWPGYSVDSVGDDYGWHEQAVGGIAMRPSWTGHIAEVHDHFAQTIARGPRENPLISIAEQMGDQGHQMTVSSSALQFVPASGFEGGQTVLAALDSLAAAAPLPPARYVDRHGQVHAPSA